MKFTIETDHKPLVPLLGCKELHQLPPRILRFRLRLSRYNYTIVHVPGKILNTADALSHDPLPRQETNDEEQDFESLIIADIQYLPATQRKLDEIRKEQQSDTTCSTVSNYCQHGWPPKTKVNNEIIPYWNKQGELTVCDGSLLLGR